MDRYKSDPQGKKLIEVAVKNSKQLFDARDPAPFRERDLDDDLVEYILSSSQEFSLGKAIKLKIFISEAGPTGEESESIAESIHNHFLYEADRENAKLKKQFKNGRLFLMIGLSTLLICFLISNYIEAQFDFQLKELIREGILISGWVAMWRPIEVFLYDWWPIKEKVRYLDKLSRVEIEINDHSYG